MMILFLSLLSVMTWGNPTWKWSNSIDVVEKHEFYQNNEVITRPKGTWQVLFGIVYYDANLETFKDCLIYKVPDEEGGILKIKTIPAQEKCADYLYKEGTSEWKDLKALQYSIEPNMIFLMMTHAKFKVEKWNIPLMNVFKKNGPKALMSSAEYRSPKMIFLRPYQGKSVGHPVSGTALADKTLCHNIADDCQEVSPSTCSQCTNGWYEIPTGCTQSPKYCGQINCGQKNAPACRRGMKWEKQNKKYSCREDDSFAYCAKGLKIQCQGVLPYCI